MDNGLLRLHEGDQVMEMFGGKFGLNITRVDAESRFLGELAGVSDPEAKRKLSVKCSWMYSMMNRKNSLM